MPRARGDSSRPESGPYLMESVLRVCDVLEAFKSEGECLRLCEIAERTGLRPPTAMRFLYTLERRGLIERVDRWKYSLAIRILNKRSHRLGFGSHSTEFAFSRDVTESLVQAAKRQNLELIVLDNRYSSKTAIRNVEVFIRERVDLVVEFQADEHVAASVISHKLMDAGIPLIAVEIPHPGATYFGANNYLAGVIGGRYLGRWAKRSWQGAVDTVLLLELPKSGALPASRLTGLLMGIREVLPGVSDSQVIRLNGNGQFGASLEAVRKHLRMTRRSKRTLIGAINDPSAIGALRAFEEVGASENCAVLGQNAAAEARSEMRRKGSRLIGSVGYFPEKYGEGIISLAQDILRRKPVPPAQFVQHQLVTPDNVDRFYPNDVLMSASDVELSLLGSR